MFTHGHRNIVFENVSRSWYRGMEGRGLRRLCSVKVLEHRCYPYYYYKNMLSKTHEEMITMAEHLCQLTKDLTNRVILPKYKVHFETVLNVRILVLSIKMSNLLGSQTNLVLDGNVFTSCLIGYNTKQQHAFKTTCQVCCTKSCSSKFWGAARAAIEHVVHKTVSINTWKNMKQGNTKTQDMKYTMSVRPVENWFHATGTL